ncbi:MAG TPA: hypothetical protein VL576_00645 [Candidatus Paceibacterota bacterium]|jgi:hypothetical protein|nr:hypothetical protein [Candidatus Paceibacterota bacterium]
MKKQIGKTEKEMTVAELAKLMINQFENLDKKLSRKINEKIDSLASATAKGFMEFTEFKYETRENFRKVRQDIFEIKDNYAAKQELAGVVVRVENLERQK